MAKMIAYDFPNDNFFGSTAVKPKAIKAIFQNVKTSNVLRKNLRAIEVPSGMKAATFVATRLLASTVDGSFRKITRIANKKEIIPGNQACEIIPSDCLNPGFTPETIKKTSMRTPASMAAKIK